MKKQRGNETKKAISKRLASKFLIVFLSFVCAVQVVSVDAFASEIQKLEPYGGDEFFGVANKDLSHLNLGNKEEILKTLTFDTKTIWPSNMPKGFDPVKVLQWGMNPGLGLRKLHQLGYTGEGVNIAYIDQPLTKDHDEFASTNLTYIGTSLNKTVENNSMHGPAVLSVLAGSNGGVAPKSHVYYFGHPAYVADQVTHAEALKQLIQTNAKLPMDKKIRIVGFSDAPDPSEKNIKIFQDAIIEAENNNIMVFDVTTLNIIPLEAVYPKDKDLPANYRIANWAKDWKRSNPFYVPTSGVTTAVGHANDKSHYVYWSNGGLSWAVPYIVGVIALGLQINPNLTKEQCLHFLRQSSTPYRDGGMINPEGFVRLVEEDFKKKENASQYYYVLYHGNKVSNNDMLAIQDYVKRLSSDGTQVILKDVKSFLSATDIYDALKAESMKYKGQLKGIQIFGSSDDVPAFQVVDKVQMINGIHDGGTFRTDLFYSNFNNSSAVLKNNFSSFRNFAEKLSVDFVPQWNVSRLPLTKGEIAVYINKYYDYRFTTKSSKPVYVNFSNPIFANPNHNDDMGYFLDRMANEFGILKNADYRLYGNTLGEFPVKTKILGGFTKENLTKENSNVVHYVINTHGQADNIDNAIFVKTSNLSDFTNKFVGKIRSSSSLQNGLTEIRSSLVNSSNINSVLNRNYYTLTLWTCSNAQNLSTGTIVHKALSQGKAIDSMAASSLISNNGVNNKVSLAEMKQNNFYYFMYELFNSASKSRSRSESFFQAKRLYASEIMKNTGDLKGEGNYGFNLHNVMSYHYLGVIDIPELSNKGKMNLPKETISNNAETTSTQTSHFITNDSVKRSYKKLAYAFTNPDKKYKVSSVESATDAKKVYIRIRFSSPTGSSVFLFLQQDTPGLKEFSDEMKKGDNEIILIFTKSEIRNYKEGLAINIGDRNFIFIEKSVMNQLAK